MAETGTETHENTLSERERFVLTALLNDSDETARRRAQVVLEWGKGQLPKTIAQDLGMRTAQVNKLTRAFVQNRLELFPPPALERALRGSYGAVTVQELLNRYPTDEKHTRHVTALTLQLFDRTAAVHHIPAQWRRILETGARLHALGSLSSEEDHHGQRAHDVILAHDLEGYSPVERDVIACLALFSSKKVKPDKVALFGTLPGDVQQVTLALAAMLRVANALDFSKTQTAVLAHIHVDSVVELGVGGEQSAENVARANKKADLWREVLVPPLVAAVAADTPSAHPPAPQRVEPATRLNDAARIIIGRQFAKLVEMEAGVREGSDPEAVHDMRVATRRMHSAFRLFKPYLRRTKKLTGVMDELRELLGSVRNSDVLLDDLKGYAAARPEAEQAALDSIAEEWRKERTDLHEQLLAMLDSSAYADWCGRMSEFVATADPHAAPRVAEVVPALIWEQYGVIREFETRLAVSTPEELHRLRIDIKRLRYTLEFFAEAFGGKPADLIAPLVALQDRIGKMHDAVVGAQALTDVLAEQAQRARQLGTLAPDFMAPAAYHTHLQQEIEDIRTNLPEAFNVVVQPAYRAELANAVAAL